MPAAVPHLLDSDTFLRLAKRDDPEHALVTAAINRLVDEGIEICYTAKLDFIHLEGYWIELRFHSGAPCSGWLPSGDCG